MIVETGHFALILALFVAALQGTLPMIGAHRRDQALMAIAAPAALIQLALGIVPPEEHRESWQMILV